MSVSSASSLAQALDMAAAAASASQTGGLIPADTGVFDWFQFGGNTYVVEAINSTSTPEGQTALTATDAAVDRNDRHGWARAFSPYALSLTSQSER